MRSRIVQDQSDPGGAEPNGSKPAAPAHAQSRVARIGRWSAQHRKKAILGWLAFVVFAFMAGNAVGPKSIDTVDTFSGESHDAEVAADAAGLRPNQEIVLIHSDQLTTEDLSLIHI